MLRWAMLTMEIPMRGTMAVLMMCWAGATMADESFHREAESIIRGYRDLSTISPDWKSPTAPLASERYEPQRWSTPPASYPELTKPLPMRSTRCRPIGNHGAIQCWSD